MPSISPDGQSGAPDPRLTPARPDLAAEHLRGVVKAHHYVKGTRFTVDAQKASLRAGPEGSAMQVSELLHGEGFIVYDEREGVAWGQAVADSYVGYVRRAHLTEDAAAASHVVSTCFAHLYSEPTLKCPAKACLPMGAKLALGGESPCGRYRRLATSNLWVHSRQTTPIEDLRADPLAIAELFLGAPYLWGGKTAAGLDCSALIQLPLFMAGHNIPRDSDLQRAAMAKGLGRPVQKEACHRGDIAFFPGHVGFMVDRDRLLHANATRMAVTIDPLARVLEWVARDCPQPFLEIYCLADKR